MRLARLWFAVWMLLFVCGASWCQQSSPKRKIIIDQDAAGPGGVRKAAGGHHSQAGSTWIGLQSTSVATAVAWNVRADRPKQASRWPASRTTMAASSRGAVGQPGPTVGVGEARSVGVGPWLTASDGCNDGFAAEQPIAAADSTNTPSIRPSRRRIG